MSADLLLFLTLGAALGGFVNGLAGFGTSLFALGWWLQVMEPRQAVAIVLVMSVASGLQGAWLVRRQIRPARLGRFLLPALIGIPLGLWILTWIEAGPLKITVALFLLLYSVFFLTRRTLPAVTRPLPGVDIAVGGAGGILGAMAGLSGALPTMWLAMRPWPKAETRAVLQPYNILVLGISAALLAIGGAYDRDTLLLTAAALPTTMIAAQAGLWVFGRLSDTAFRRLLVGLMLVSGVLLLMRETV